MSRTSLFTAAAAALLIFILWACSYNSALPSEDSVIGYYTKEIVLSSWVDDEETWWDELETRLYDETGKLIVVSKNTYGEMDEPGYYMVSRTDVYEVEPDGTQTLVEYYLYEYFKDEYEYLDDDGNTVYAVDYLLLSGKSYSADDVLRLYYDVVYDDTHTDGDDTDDINYAYYTSIIDKRTSDGESTAEQYAVYITDPDGYKHFRTEKYFVRNQDDTDLELEKEFASWYDTDYPYDYLYDLYHSFRGDDGSEEFYYFTRYSRNDTGRIYEQADYEYDAALVPKLSLGNYFDDSFDDTSAGPSVGDDTDWITGPITPFDYLLDFNSIGEKASVLTTEYDENGNIILDQRWYKGELIEYTSYAYNSSNELTDEHRYTEGGTLLRDRRTVRFRDEVLYGAQYSLKETCEYKYYDYSDTEPQDAARIVRPYESYADKDDFQRKHMLDQRLNRSNRK